MSLRINNQVFSLEELRLAVALHLHGHASDDTIGSVITTRRTGFGSRPIACYSLITTRDSPHTSHHQIYAAVRDDPTYWEAEARMAYQRWRDGHSQIVQRLNAQGNIGPYLDTHRG